MVKVERSKNSPTVRIVLPAKTGFREGDHALIREIEGGLMVQRVDESVKVVRVGKKRKITVTGLLPECEEVDVTVLSDGLVVVKPVR